MREMREFEWQLLKKSLSVAMGSRRLILIKVANYEYMVRL